MQDFFCVCMQYCSLLLVAFLGTYRGSLADVHLIQLMSLLILTPGFFALPALGRNSSQFERLPVEIYSQILLRSSQLLAIQQHDDGLGDDEQQQQQHKEQRQYLCGILPLVNHKWQQLAWSLCSSLTVRLYGEAAAKSFRAWLQRHGCRLQHLSIFFSALSMEVLPLFFPHTPKLRSLSISLLNALEPIHFTTTSLSALSKLTQLQLSCNLQSARDIDALKSLTSLQQLELKFARFQVHVGSPTLNCLAAALPQLLSLDFRSLAGGYTKGITALTGLTQLQQLKGKLPLAKLPELGALPWSCLQLLRDGEEISSAHEQLLSWLDSSHPILLEELSLPFPINGVPCPPLFQQLHQLPKLVRLGVDISAWSQESFILLRQLTQLTGLDLLSGSEVGLQELAKVPLEALPNLNFSLVSNCSLPQAACNSIWVRQQLTFLDLSYSGIGDDAMPSLGRLSQLQRLDLRMTAVSAAGLVHLSGLTLLTSLTIPNLLEAGRDVGAVAAVSRLTRLRTLQLSDTCIYPPDLEAAAAVLKVAMALRGLQTLALTITWRRLALPTKVNAGRGDGEMGVHIFFVVPLFGYGNREWCTFFLYYRNTGSVGSECKHYHFKSTSKGYEHTTLHWITVP